MNSEKILKETDSVLKDFENSLISLNEKCVNYIYEFDIYSRSVYQDATTLKEKMKEKIIQAVPNDI